MEDDSTWVERAIAFSAQNGQSLYSHAAKINRH